MDVIAAIVKNLLVIIIVSSFLEIMLPEGNIKPFVRFAIGLFILIAILNPTLAYLYSDKNFEISVWDDQVDEKTTQAIATGGQKITEQITGQSNVIMKEKLAGQISAVASLVPGVDNVQTELTVSDNGSLQKLKLIVRPGADTSADQADQIKVFSSTAQDKSAAEHDEIQRKLKQVMGNLYGLQDNNIEIVFEGG
jgi:stage III sporulation protein AF